jgi:crotonobetainyl-CoA:carnitine CoA-transferase CaiB-like acyl-CoA transferase
LPTNDGRHLAFSCLQGFRYWADLCRVIDRPELVDDERFATHEALMANGTEAAVILREVFASAPLATWRERLDDFTGQWAVVQNTLEVADDPQAVANDYVLDATTADGTPFKLVATPVQFGGVAAVPTRAPEFNEHGDAILASLGIEGDALIDLKIKGVVA